MNEAFITNKQFQQGEVSKWVDGIADNHKKKFRGLIGQKADELDSNKRNKKPDAGSKAADGVNSITRMLGGGGSGDGDDKEQ